MAEGGVMTNPRVWVTFDREGLDFVMPSRTEALDHVTDRAGDELNLAPFSVVEYCPVAELDEAIALLRVMTAHIASDHNGNCLAGVRELPETLAFLARYPEGRE